MAYTEIILKLDYVVVGGWIVGSFPEAGRSTTRREGGQTEQVAGDRGASRGER